MNCPYQRPTYRHRLYTLEEVRAKQLDAYHEGVASGTRIMKENYANAQKIKKYQNG